MPLVIAGGAGVMRSRDRQAFVSTIFPSFSWTLNAAMLPCADSPLVSSNLAAGCGGPHTGASTQRFPSASSYDARLPHVPAPAKSMASFEISSDLNSGVR